LAQACSPILGIISEEQSTFAQGRIIFYNIITAYEYLNFMRANGTKRNRSFALKLDMSKAYHQVEWPYVFTISWKGWDSARDGFV
jgi:hypothetical protein